MSQRELRETVRSIYGRRYGRRCGYCGVHEEEMGARMEIDHFKPQSVGGGDELQNLVYCCPMCNRLKGDYWSDEIDKRLIHPKQDRVEKHLREDASGRLIALTPRGELHLNRLRLNRAPLVALRQARREVAFLQEALARSYRTQEELRRTIARLEEELEIVLEQISGLSDSL